MCQLCQNHKPGQTSILQEVFHELELGTSRPAAAGNAALPLYRLPWRERRAQRSAPQSGTSRETSLLAEVFESL